MFRLVNIIQKNFRLLLRAKASALIIILGPLLLVLLIGMAFSGSTFNDIRVGVYSSSYSELTESLISALGDNQFSVTKVASDTECVDGVKFGRFHVCAIFPPNLDVENLPEGGPSPIIFHVDYSRINLVYAILDTISKKVAVKSSELSGELVQVLLDTLENSRIELINKKEVVSELATDNSELKSKIDSIMGEVSKLSIDFNITEIDKELGDLANETNDTALLNVIDDVRDQIKDITADVSASASAKVVIEEKGSSIQQSASANTEKISKLKTSLESIIGNIEGIAITQKETILSPIKTQIEPITAKKTHWNYIFPTLVILMVSFVSLLLSTTLVVREKNTRAYFRNFITPTNEFIFLIGTYLTCLLILIIQLFIIFGQAFFFLKNELLAVIATTWLFLFIIASVFVFLGMLIGYLFKSEETAILASMSVAAFLLFFSNTILPIETIPHSLKVLATFNPFVLGEAVLKKLILFKAPFSNLMFELYMLVGYLALFLVLTLLAKEFTKRRIQ